MANRIKVEVSCPNCDAPLMEPGVLVDGLESILFLVKIRNQIGHLHLSQVYGSYSKLFKDVEDVAGAVVECSCPRCYAPFPVAGDCECKAPIIALSLKYGGNIKVCTRNGCHKHSLEFENIDEAFFFFKNQDEVGLF